MDIAVIGMSGIFPEANDLDEFYFNLLNGVDSVRELPERRSVSGGGERSRLLGYLEQIDEFDYNFFNISRAEAENMDPHQRILLQLVCSAIENAGYSLEEFRGSQTSIILNSPGAPKLEYLNLVEKFHPTLITGNAHAMYAGRISYFLGLRGPAMMIDTSCSSSLTSLHESCNKLLLGEADQAITGGIKLRPNLNFTKNVRFGIEASDSKCKAFDDSADGIVGGEGGGILILKPLDRAIQDRDVIHAVIKGSALNQDGDRSNGITAPSPQAQTEVITTAWRKAGIDPTTISYIEAHGTGTHLGDPIEIQGLTDAFNQFTDHNNFCYIGSLKTNIGHLGEAAGISSVIKTILSLKHKKLFPSLHFNKPNSHIDFKNTAVKVNNVLQDWDMPAEEKRRAGVSAFALTGTNAHVVLEEAPKISKNKIVNEKSPYLFTLSAQTPSSLIRYKENLTSYLKESLENINNISFVLNKGRKDFSYRYACVSRNKEELIAKLTEMAEPSISQSERPIVFLFSHEFQIADQVYTYLTTQHPKCREIYKNYLELPNLNINHENVRNFISQYLLYEYWKCMGITPATFIGTGIGNLIVDYIMGKIDLEFALTQAESFCYTNQLDEDKVKRIITSLHNEKQSIFLAMSQQSDLLQKIHCLGTGLDNFVAIPSHKDNSYQSLMETQAELYMQGVSINWTSYYKHENLYRVELPTYPFERERCWLEVTKADHSFKELSTEDDKESNSIIEEIPLTGDKVKPIEKEVATIWMSALKVDQLDVTDDFFDIGGNSLIAVHIIEKLEQLYNIELAFDVLFDYSTIHELSEYINSLIKEEQNATTNLLEIEASNDLSENQEHNPLSFSEESMWYLHHFEPDSSSYNIPFGMRLIGVLEQEVLERSIKEIILRHESFRTIFPAKDGKPVALKKEFNFNLNCIDLQDMEETLQENLLNQIYKEETLKPFDLEMGPLIRVKLIKLKQDQHVLIVITHHIISDNWSFQIFQNELVTIYQAFVKNLPSPLEEINYQYRDFAIWQRENMTGEELNKNIEFWSKKLSGAPELLELPIQKKRPQVQSFKGDTCSFNIPLEIVSKLNSLSRKQDATLFMTLLAGWKVLLNRYSGQKDIVVGIPTAGRKVLTEKVIGHCVNSIALRTIHSGNPTFDDLLQLIKQEVLEAFNHQDFPFNLVVDKLSIPRNLSYTPVFQVFFDFHHNHMIKELKVPGFEVSPLEKHINTVKGDLEMVIANGQDGMEGLLIYNTDIFEETAMRKMIEDYIEILEFISRESNVHILDIRLSQNQSKKILSSTITDHDDTFRF
ncbi:condensation domain-containing protein [Bacillus cereus]|uniref:condensation domain-containing protein n=1 Tax=Bacillus cereus TaxID=1396 RepID=UPI001374BDB3|nr:condensation domain-containing protein [Bacillus cereus]